jgi:hypothetical protein
VAYPESVVWMVNARTGLQGRQGRLRLAGTRLVFEPRSNSFGDTVLQVAEIKKVRRVRGSPVLEVSVDRPDFPELTGFYFVKPPDLRENEAGSFLPFFGRRRARKSSLNVLRGANVRTRDEIEDWVRAISEAKEP